LAGGIGGAVAALGDFGAQWLWLPWWSDRIELLIRLLCGLVPAGALLGGLFGAALATGRSVARSLAHRVHPGASNIEPWVWPVPLALLAGPGFAYVGHRLVEGGTMARLPAKDAVSAGAALALLGGFYAALRGGAWLVDLTDRGSRRRAMATAGALLAVYFVLSKLDQRLYPKLYEYLHAVLALAAFGVAALAARIVLPHARRSNRYRRSDSIPFPGAERLGDGPHPAGRQRFWASWARRLRPAAIGLLLSALFVGHLATVARNPNVRVGLFDPRASVSRSMMRVILPLLPGSRGRREATLARNDATPSRRRTPTDWTVRPEAHVLVITVDALRADHLGAYGYDRPISPEIDALAERAVVFEHAYAPAPHSSYSLCSTMTSEYLHETVDLERPLPSATLASAAADAGLYTAGLFTDAIFHTEGKRLGRYARTALGFERHDPSNLGAEDKTDQALRELDRIVELGEPPSLLWVHYFDVHEPYRERALGDRPVDRYDGEIRNVDRAIGRLLRAAEERLDRELVVVLSADHGEEFRDHGGLYHGSTLYDEQIRVPLVLRVPGTKASRVETPVELVDLAPTLLGLLDIRVPASMRGHDLRGLAFEDAGNDRTSQVGPAFAGVASQRMVVDWPHKLIADLRFQLYELYDLEADPHERRNLAGRRPETLARLQDRIDRWLEGLRRSPRAPNRHDPNARALARGRLGDRRAVEALGRLVEDEGARTAMRAEAARLLGDLHGKAVADILANHLAASESALAAQAAIALGRLSDERARAPLRRLVHVEDPRLRARAALSLGRLGDEAAVPALIDALWTLPDKAHQRRAIRLLGQLGDRRALAPLVSLVGEFRLRRHALVALGELGFPAAYEPIVDVLSWEHRPTHRDAVAHALGLLRDPRAVVPLARLAANEPELENVGESLVRLGAPAQGAVGGSDFGPDSDLRHHGFGGCERTRSDRWHYLGRTFCRTESTTPTAILELPRPKPPAAVLLLRLRRAEGADPLPVHVDIGGQTQRLRVGAELEEHRLPLDPSQLDERHVRLSFELPQGAAIDVDHALIVPSTP
jgi:arylsulfatase A-like enzyme